MAYTSHEDFLAGIIRFNEEFTIKPAQSTSETGFITPNNALQSKTLQEPAKQKANVVTISAGSSALIGKKGEKKYKLVLDVFNEKLFLLSVVDISHGVGCVMVKKMYIKRQENIKELKVNIGRLQVTI